MGNGALHRGTVGAKRPQAVLAFADGSFLCGEGFGFPLTADQPAVGEVVFNTSLYGYQEILTDPSYAGQLMTFTAPHIGNVGCNDEDTESELMHAEGLICRELSPMVSNFRASESLEQYLIGRRKMGISKIDTRFVTAMLRDKGAQMGALAMGDAKIVDTLVDHARAAGSMEGKDYVKAVACKESYSWNSGAWELGKGYATLTEERLSGRPHVVAIDCGIKRNILRLLVDAGFRVSVMPAGVSAEQITQARPDALFLSNGPGDPATLDYVVKPVAKLLGRFPIFGICLGHQILGRVLGGKTYKLKFGHRGGNHPVIHVPSGRIDITVQNHGFAVHAENLSHEAIVSHINLNDRTVEGLEVPSARAFSVQYHPESSPGPHDALHLFRKFYEMVVTGNDRVAGAATT